MRSNRIRLPLIVLLAVMMASASAATSYMQEVHLRDGRTATCRVNQAARPDSSGASSLSVADRTEAEIDSTASLRKTPPPRDTYPNPSNAPVVDCY
jgi:hypothetical protein